MLDTTQIEEIVDNLIDLWKKDKGKTVFNTPKPQEVEYYPGYCTFKSWRKAISVHSVKGVVPTELLSKKAPCQSDEELQYVLDNYKQITLPVPEEFLNTIGRGLHSSNWSIQYVEQSAELQQTDNTMQQYLEADIALTPLGMPFESWWRFVLPSIQLNDPMGVLGVKPWQPEKVVEDVETGVQVVAGDVLPEPIPFYYTTDQVMSPLDAPYFLVDTNERSWVEYAGKRQKIGFIFELYDDQVIWRITQVGKYIEDTYEITPYYKHGLGYIPATRLKGRPTYYDNKIVWQSQLTLVVDILDEAILDNTNLRSIKASSTYPQKVMLGNVCRHEVIYDGVPHKCEQGYILNQKGTGYDKCNVCMGSGLQMRTSPLNTILIKPKDSLDQGDQIKPSEALNFQQPSTESAQFLRSEVIDHLNRSKEILHLKTTNAVVKGAEDMTATGMAIDEKAKNAFLSQPVNQIFDTGEFVIKCIGAMRYGDKFGAPTIQRPVTYDFNSEADYLNNIAKAQESGAPPVVIQGYLSKYLKSVYYDDKRVARIYDLMLASDRLLSLSQEEINIKLARNLVEPWEVILHDSARSIIDNLLLTNPGFLELDLIAMKEALIAAAKALVPALPAGQRALTPDQILANANAPRTTPSQE
jgi:hypothetical protein